MARLLRRVARRRDRRKVAFSQIQAPKPSKNYLPLETIKMNPTSARAPVDFTLTNDNAFALLGGFSRAARAAGWTEAQVEETVAQAMTGDYIRLQCTLARYCVEYLPGN